MNRKNFDLEKVFRISRASLEKSTLHEDIKADKEVPKEFTQDGETCMMCGGIGWIVFIESIFDTEHNSKTCPNCLGEGQIK